MRIKLVVACTFAMALSGCGHAKPKLAGGKPVSFWLQSLQSGDVKQRKTAVFRLGNMATVAPGVLAAVIGVLQDEDDAVRCEAILAVLKNGQAALAALPALAALQQNDPNARVRSYAARAQQKLQRGT